MKSTFARKAAHQGSRMRSGELDNIRRPLKNSRYTARPAAIRCFAALATLWRPGFIRADGPQPCGKVCGQVERQQHPMPDYVFAFFAARLFMPSWATKIVRFSRWKQAYKKHDIWLIGLRGVILRLEFSTIRSALRRAGSQIGFSEITSAGSICSDGGGRVAHLRRRVRFERWSLMATHASGRGDVENNSAKPDNKSGSRGTGECPSTNNLSGAPLRLPAKGEMLSFMTGGSERLGRIRGHRTRNRNTRRPQRQLSSFTTVA